MSDHDHRHDLPPEGVELLFDRVVAGEASETELRAYQAWEAMHPDSAMQFTLVRRAVTAQSDPLYSPAAGTQMAARARDDLQQSSRNVADIFAPGHSAQHGAYRLGRRGIDGLGTWILRRWTWSAGVISLIALIAVFSTKHTPSPSGVAHTYRTAVGQRATLQLDDGTRVMMAPQTTLRLVEFSEHSRTVALDGDAYFVVAQSAGMPFIVRSGATTVRVLGTAFEVRHYSGDAEVRVAVASGKVLVSSGTHYPAVSVTAGHVASVTDSIPSVKAVDNIESEIGWLGDRLVFQNAPMPKVLATLTRWYGYRFRCADSALVLSNITIGLSMRSSAEALASLEQILNVSLTVVGDTVTLTPVRARGVTPQRTKRYDVWVPTREVGR